MSRHATAARVRAHKERHPEVYCRVVPCLQRTSGVGGKPCARHPRENPHAFVHGDRFAGRCDICGYFEGDTDLHKSALPRGPKS